MKHKILCSALAGILTVSATASNVYAEEMPAKQSQEGHRDWIERLINTSAMKAKLESPDWNLFGIPNINVGYYYQVRPSYTGGLFSRYDKFYVNAGVEKGKLLKAVEDGAFSTGLTIKQTGEVQFVRQYKNGTEAATAMPYFVENIPSTTEKALTGLQPGDYFSMKFPMNIVAGGNFVNMLAPNLALIAEAHYLMAGDFQLHVLRLKDNQVRLKLVGLKTREKSASVGMHLTGAVKFLKFDYANKKFLDTLDLKPVEFIYNNGENNVFMVDYVLDLNDPAVAAAYNQVFKNTLQAQEIWKNALPSLSILKKPLMMDIEPIDKLAREGGRVKRSFKGDLDSEYTRKTLAMKIGLIRVTEEKECSKNQISSVKLKDSVESTQYYNLRSCHIRSSRGSILNYLSLSKTTRMTNTYAANDKHENQVPDDFIYAYEKQDSKFKDRDLKATQEDLKSVIPNSIYNMIDFSKWNNDKPLNVGVYFQMVIHPEGILKAPNRSKQEIAALMEEYLKNFSAAEVAYDISRNNNSEQNALDYARVINAEKAKVITSLATAFDNRNSDLMRIEALEVLHQNLLFQRLGIRFLVELMDQRNLEQTVRFDLAMSSTAGKNTNANKLTMSFGTKKEDPIYDRLMLIQGLINNDGIDLRLEAETLTKDRMGLK